ncbi:PAP/OAS1 substrate-binding domain superfamily [Abeliophyllum distichum]|uniref:PAP/OAS1 substrate-binding domain superfamily n=1 Tax=Abeliophyllum distichum TaxID=126358 RepID=A0ABD1QJN1_9LAMI
METSICLPLVRENLEDKFNDDLKHVFEGEEVEQQVPSRCVDKNLLWFQKKRLNIVDILKDTNNLGRGVSKGKFYWIRSAFSYGARKRGGILLQGEDHILSELHNFFSDNIERHTEVECLLMFTILLPLVFKALNLL